MVLPLPSLSASALTVTALAPAPPPLTTTWKASNSLPAASSAMLVAVPDAVVGRTFVVEGATHTDCANAGADDKATSVTRVACFIAATTEQPLCHRASE